jgi:uncharacterized protein (TIGR03437 family)
MPLVLSLARSPLVESSRFFGKGLQASASSGQVLVNGEVAPVFFANGSQVNAEIPYDVPTDKPVSLSLTSAGTSSNTVQLSMQPAAPGIFTSTGNRAVVENADYSINSPSNPAHLGDFVTVYLTGGGAVSPAVATGVPTPSTPLSRVNAPNSVSIGGTAALVYFLGLTPRFEGLYQANVQVPTLGRNRLMPVTESTQPRDPVAASRRHR